LPLKLMAFFDLFFEEFLFVERHGSPPIERSRLKETAQVRGLRPGLWVGTPKSQRNFLIRASDKQYIQDELFALLQVCHCQPRRDGMPRQPLDSLIHLNDLCGFQYMSDEWSSVLSIREREVAFLVARGLANKEIARELGLSHGTVKQHVHSILLKLRSQKFLKSGTLNRYMLIHLINGSQRRDAADC
jgi:hypothetical protein